MKNIWLFIFVFLLAAYMLETTPVLAGEKALAKESQNPLNTVVSVPFENNPDWSLQFQVKFLFPK
jgi:hypothetical protein